MAASSQRLADEIQAKQTVECCRRPANSARFACRQQATFSHVEKAPLGCILMIIIPETFNSEVRVSEMVIIVDDNFDYIND